MNKKLMIMYFMLSVSLICIMESGCQAGGGQAGTPEPGNGTSTEVLSQDCQTGETPVLNEISLDGHTSEAFAYNMAENTICFLEHSGRTYSLYTITAKGTVQKSDSKWRTPSGYILDNFVYGADGAFYAVLKHYNNKSKTIQSFVQLKKDGTYQAIKLKNLNQIPKTKLDSSDLSITDIHFSGTALSVLYSNYAVKFYNIAERLPLGDSHITGTAGQAAFYNSVFASTGLTDGYKSILNFYDIRTGETRNSFSMEDLAMGEILLLANYRDSFYLLTKNGLYTGSITDPGFTLVCDTSSLGLPSGGRIHRLYAARDDTLYLVWQDSQAVYHLYSMETISS